MLRSTLRLLPLVVVGFALSSSGASAQSLQELAGGWALDRASSSFGPGDPGADRVEIAFSPTEVTVRRFFNPGSPTGSVWTLPLDGAAPPFPQRGSARVVDGDKLVITHVRAQQLVTHVYTVAGDALTVDRSIQSSDGTDLKHTMVFKRVN
jgi:hypothetical protein